jgi:hypothetical protein
LSSYFSFAFKANIVFLLSIKSISQQHQQQQHHQQEQHQQQQHNNIKVEKENKVFMDSCVSLTLGQTLPGFLPGDHRGGETFFCSEAKFKR